LADASFIFAGAYSINADAYIILADANTILSVAYITIADAYMMFSGDCIIKYVVNYIFNNNLLIT